MDGQQFQSLAEAYKSVYESSETEQLDEQITGGSVMARLAGHNRGRVLDVNLSGKDGSVGASVDRTQQAGGLTDKADQQMSNWKFDKPLELDTTAAKTDTQVSVRPNLSFASPTTPKPKPETPVKKVKKPKPDPTKTKTPKPDPTKTTTPKPEPEVEPKPETKTTEPPRPTTTTATPTKGFGGETTGPRPVAQTGSGGETTGPRPAPVATASAPVVRSAPVATASAPVVRSAPVVDPRRMQNVTSDTTSDLDTYNLVLEYLISEGYASSEESADKIILNMSEAWFVDIMELTGGKGHPGYKAGSKDHGDLEDHPAAGKKGGVLSPRYGNHLGDMDDEDEDEDDLESVVKQQSRDRRETVRKPLRDKVKAARKKMTKEEIELVDEARRSEKEGKGSPESPLSYPGRKIQKERGEKGGRHQYSGSVEYGGAAAERGKKKSDPHSQEQRLRKLRNYPEKLGKYYEMQRKKRGGDIGSRFD